MKFSVPIASVQDIRSAITGLGNRVCDNGDSGIAE